MNVLLFGQTKQNNSIVVIENDTFALIPQAVLDASYIKYLDYEKQIELLYDSVQKLNALNENLQAKIYAKDVFIDAKDTTYYTLKRIYSSLQKDYNKLRKPKLNGIIGGGVSAAYNLDSQRINDLAIKLNVGLMFKRKYITSFDIGIGLNRSLVFGFNGGLVF